MEEKSRQIEWQTKIQGRFYGELQKALPNKEECGEATGCGGGKPARKGGGTSRGHTTHA